jgi:hypothetical protein
MSGYSSAATCRSKGWLTDTTADRRRSGETSTNGGLTIGHLQPHSVLHLLDGRDRFRVTTPIPRGQRQPFDQPSIEHTAAACYKRVGNGTGTLLPNWLVQLGTARNEGRSLNKTRHSAMIWYASGQPRVNYKTAALPLCGPGDRGVIAAPGGQSGHGSWPGSRALGDARRRDDRRFPENAWPPDEAGRGSPVTSARASPKGFACAVARTNTKVETAVSSDCSTMPRPDGHSSSRTIRASTRHLNRRLDPMSRPPAAEHQHQRETRSMSACAAAGARTLAPLIK